MKTLSISAVDIPITSEAWTENISVKTLDKLLRSDYIVSTKWQDSTYDNERDQLKALRAKISSTAGKNVVKYHTGRDRMFGRVYPERSLALGSVRREIRWTLAHDTMVDIDIVNAHPNILLQICQHNSVPCSYLKEYVEKRDYHLEKIKDIFGVSRDQAKILYLLPMFGGSSKTWLRDCNIPETMRDKIPAFFHQYRRECRDIAKTITSANPAIKDETKRINPDKTDYEIEASSMSIFLQEYERRILEVCVAFCKKKGLIKKQTASLIFDGFMIEKTREFIAMKDRLLFDLMVEVNKKTGFDLKFEYKEMIPYDLSTITLSEEESRLTFVDLTPADLEEYVAKKKIFETTMFYMNEQNAICEEHADGNLSIYKTTDEDRFKLEKYLTIDAVYGKTTKTVPFKKVWIGDTKKRHYSRFVFEPNPACVKEDEYNMFKGIRASRLTCKPNPKGVERFMTILKTLATDRVEFVLKWNAHLVQKLWEKPGSALVFSGAQGIGKDTIFADLIGNKIIGTDGGLFMGIKDIETELFGTHSTAMEKALLLNLEEVSPKKMRSYSSNLKAAITSSSVSINPKGLPAYSLSNYSRFVMSSNDADPVKMEDGDRRYVLCFCDPKYKGNSSFWEETHKLFKDDECVKAIYDYLMSIDLSDFNPRVIPRTEAEEMLMASEKPSEEAFMIYMAQTNESKTELKLSSKDIYEHYEEYCRTSDQSKYSSVNFGRKIARFMATSPPLIRDRTRRATGFILTLDLDAIRINYRLNEDPDTPTTSEPSVSNSDCNIRIPLIDDAFEKIGDFSR